jgi:hypothetical protein
MKVNIFNIQVILIANFMATTRVSRIETGVQNMDSGYTYSLTTQCRMCASKFT